MWITTQTMESGRGAFALWLSGGRYEPQYQFIGRSPFGSAESQRFCFSRPLPHFLPAPPSIIFISGLQISTPSRWLLLSNRCPMLLFCYKVKSIPINRQHTLFFPLCNRFCMPITRSLPGPERYQGVLSVHTRSLAYFAV